MPRIFISYRRDDSRAIAGRIYDRLVEAFGEENIFKDVDRIPPGSTFAQVLEAELNKCNVLLIIIGRQWLNITDQEGHRRLENPEDFVRIEVERGLNRPDLLVIPVLVDEANVPNPADLPDSLDKIASLQVVQVRHDPDFHRDMNRLIDFLNILRQQEEAVQTREQAVARQNMRRTLTGVGATVALVIVGLLVLVARGVIQILPTPEPTLDDRAIAMQLMTFTAEAYLAESATPTVNATATIEAILTQFVTETDAANATATAFGTATADAYTDTPIPTMTPSYTPTEDVTATLYAQKTLDAQATANVPTNTPPPTMTPTLTSTSTSAPSNTPTRTLTATPNIAATQTADALQRAKAQLDAQATQAAQATLDSQQAIATVNTSSANIRSGPGTEYSAVSAVVQGDQLEIIARSSNSDNTWYLVTLANKKQGWISSSVVDLNSSHPVIRVAVTIPPPPVVVTVPPVIEGDTTSCSDKSDVPSSFTLTNNSRLRINVYWIDFQCQEVLYSTLESGQSISQNSFVTHSWRLRNAETNQVLKGFTISNSTPSIITYP